MTDPGPQRQPASLRQIAAQAKQVRNEMTKPHPIQPIITDENGVRRFKQNAIVRHLIDCGSIDLNAIGFLPFSQDDREQFAQLIGYSLSGFSELSYVSDAAWDRVMAKREAGE